MQTSKVKLWLRVQFLHAKPKITCNNSTCSYTIKSRSHVGSFVKDTLFQTDSRANRMPVHGSCFHCYASLCDKRGTALMYTWPSAGCMNYCEETQIWNHENHHSPLLNCNNCASMVTTTWCSFPIRSLDVPVNANRALALFVLGASTARLDNQHILQPIGSL